MTVDVLKVPSPWTCKDNIWNLNVQIVPCQKNPIAKIPSMRMKSRISPVQLAEYVDGFCQLDNTWHVCKIVDIREQDLEKEYLLHYSGWQSKYD